MATRSALQIGRRDALKPVQALALSRQRTARRTTGLDAKEPFRSETMLRQVGATVIPSSQEIQELDVDALYEIAYGGESNYFESPEFETQKEEEKKYLTNMTRTLHVEESVYECPHCKFNRVIVSQKQLRSGDEGMTTLLRCTRCGQEWRKD